MNRTFCTLWGVVLLVGIAVTGRAQTLEIADAKLGKNVVDREIVEETSTFLVGDRVYVWMRVTGGPVDSLVVSWKTGDQEYSTKLNIGGSPWRTWAYKSAATAGEWRVHIKSADGDVLKELGFTVQSRSE